MVVDVIETFSWVNNTCLVNRNADQVLDIKFCFAILLQKPPVFSVSGNPK
ncbi:uncharacterized protein METZ01_LOCUS219954 [marine metagenome]|uniref:Uncharacterized protein n=1 Tax=marine metagenome TaxID=408172 RepID=A0A382FVT0_9ZZZZ